MAYTVSLPVDRTNATPDTVPIGPDVDDLADAIQELRDKAVEVGAQRDLAAATETVQTYTIIGDGSNNSAWPNRVVWEFQPNAGTPQIVQWVNEFGELRLIPSAENRVAFRIFAKNNTADPDHVGPVMEFNRTRNPFGDRETVFGVDGDGNVDAVGNVTAANLPAGIYVIENGAADPAGAGPGAVILEKAAA